MTNRTGLSLLVLGMLSLTLTTCLDVLIAGGEAPSLGFLVASWTIDVMLLVAIATLAQSDRACLGLASLINGGISVAAILAKLILPASAAAPYEVGGEPIESLDLTLPVAARLHEALASAYFSISVIIAGMIFFAAAYLLLHRDDGAPHPH